MLLVYPKEHRQAYGEPMTQLLRDRLRAEGGGARSTLVWLQVASDLATTALSERTETTLDTLKHGWWRIAAAFIGVAMAFLGIGNLFGGDDGPLYGKIVAAAVGLAAAGLIFAGLALRWTNRARGSLLIGIGVAPAALLVVFLWFPPVAAVGVLAIVVALKAFTDAGRGLTTEPVEVAG